LILELFNVLEEICPSFSSSTKHFVTLKEKAYWVVKSLNLRNLSQTQWTARGETIQAILTSFGAMFSALEEIKQIKNAEKKTRVQRMSSEKKILNFHFIACLMYMKNIMYKINIATEKLEEEDINIIDTIEMLGATKKLFERIVGG